VVTTVGPALLSILLILAAIIHDWRKRGRPHPITVWVGAAIIVAELVRVPLSATPQWLAIAGAMGGFGR
jgi:hypothetical protein